MQANNDPKWTDDAAFWNEAWADMDDRLDEKKSPSRKIAVVWWRRYGWLLGLVVLAVAVATPSAMAYLSQDENMEQKEFSPILPIAPATPAIALPAVIADNDSKPSTLESKTADQSPNEAIAASSSLNSPGVKESSTKPNATSSPRIALKEPLSATMPDDERGAEIEAAATTPLLAAAAPVNEQGISILNKPTTGPITREIPPALTSLTNLPIGTIEFAQKLGIDQLSAVITKPKLASRLYLDAGVSNGLQGTNIGYYAGLQYDLPISKRFSIPVSVRLRKSFHDFKELAESSTPSRFLEASDITTGAGAPDTILITFSEDNIDEIATTAFEGRIGLNYSPAPRWQIGTSVSLSYLIAATARISPEYQAEFNNLQSDRSIFDADIALVNSFNFSREDAALSAVGTPILAGSGSPGFPQFNQFVAQAGLNISYDLTRKLTLTMAGRRVLTQPDQSKVLGLQRGQLEIGARFRLK